MIIGSIVIYVIGMVFFHNISNASNISSIVFKLFLNIGIFIFILLIMLITYNRIQLISLKNQQNGLIYWDSHLEQSGKIRELGFQKRIQQRKRTNQNNNNK